MTDTTEPRDPRTDPRVGPTPAPCYVLDLYGYPVACDTPDPCTLAATTLYRVQDCGPDNPPLADWCRTYPEHPVCPVVAVGEPPVPGLPATGGVVGLGVGAGLLLAGVLLLFGARRRKAQP